MATTTVQIRMDADLKTETEALLHEMGLTMTTAMNIFAKAIVKRKRIPFAITASNSALEDDLADARAHRNLSRAFSTPNELFDDLRLP